MSMAIWRPTHRVNSLWRMMDRMLEEGNLANAHPQAWCPALDVLEKEDAYSVEVALPGIDPEDVEITFDDGLLTISGEAKLDETLKAEDYRLRERRYGEFSRSLRFPRDIDAEQIAASYTNGILKVHVPKVEALRPKKIAVQVQS